MGIFEDILAFFQDPPPEDWKYREKGLLSRGSDALRNIGGPREGSPHIMGVDPLYDLVNTANRRMLERNPIAEPGPEQPVVYPKERINVEELRQYGGPNLIDERARLYREAYPNIRLSERSIGDSVPSQGLGLDGSPSGPQFQPDPNSPWAPSVQEFFANFPQEALAPSLRRGERDGLDGSGIPSVDQGQSMHDRAQAAIAARVAQEEQAAKDAAAAKEYMLKMKAAKEQDDWVRSVGYEPDQTFSDPEKGILVEDINADKLARIRAQAAKMAGRGGPSAGGGGFSQPEMTPQIAQRQAANEIWANQQPMRDAEFAMTPGQSARRPDDAKRAAQTLSDMQRNQAIQREQAMQSALVNALGGGGGKIPFEQAMQLQAAGVKVPYGATGMSKEDAISMFDSAIQQAGQDLARVNPLEAVGDPSVKNRIVLTRYAASLADMYKQKVAAGMNPDEAQRMWQEEVTRMMLESGFLNTNEMVGQPTGAQ